MVVSSTGQGLISSSSQTFNSSSDGSATFKSTIITNTNLVVGEQLINPSTTNKESNHHHYHYSSVLQAQSSIGAVNTSRPALIAESFRHNKKIESETTRTRKSKQSSFKRSHHIRKDHGQNNRPSSSSTYLHSRAAVGDYHRGYDHLSRGHHHHNRLSPRHQSSRSRSYSHCSSCSKSTIGRSRSRSRSEKSKSFSSSSSSSATSVHSSNSGKSTSDSRSRRGNKSGHRSRISLSSSPSREPSSSSTSNRRFNNKARHSNKVRLVTDTSNKTNSASHIISSSSSYNNQDRHGHRHRHQKYSSPRYSHRSSRNLRGHCEQSLKSRQQQLLIPPLSPPPPSSQAASSRHYSNKQQYDDLRVDSRERTPLSKPSSSVQHSSHNNSFIDLAAEYSMALKVSNTTQDSIHLQQQLPTPLTSGTLPYQQQHIHNHFPKLNNVTVENFNRIDNASSSLMITQNKNSLSESSGEQQQHVQDINDKGLYTLSNNNNKSTAGEPEYNNPKQSSTSEITPENQNSKFVMNNVALNSSESSNSSMGLLPPTLLQTSSLYHQYLQPHQQEGLLPMPLSLSQLNNTNDIGGINRPRKLIGMNLLSGGIHQDQHDTPPYVPLLRPIPSGHHHHHNQHHPYHQQQNKSLSWQHCNYGGNLNYRNFNPNFGVIIYKINKIVLFY